MFLTFLPQTVFLFCFVVRILSLFCFESFFIIMRSFLLLWEYFYCCGNIFNAVGNFLQLWQFCYCCKSFFTAVGIFFTTGKYFLLPWEFFACCKNFSFTVRIFLLNENFFPKAKIFGKPCYVAYVSFCNQNVYSLEYIV